MKKLVLNKTKYVDVPEFQPFIVANAWLKNFKCVEKLVKIKLHDHCQIIEELDFFCRLQT